MQLKISIVTPSFNQAQFLEEALLSVKEQNYENLEHIVVDGASSDSSIEILKSCSSKAGWGYLRWISERDNGQTQAINKGFRMATGEILAYLCSDDLYDTDALSFVSTYFEQNPEIDFIYGGCTFLDETGTRLRAKKAERFDYQELLRRNFIWQPSVFFRSRVWKTVGPFNEELHYAMDYEYWLRATAVCRVAAVRKNLAMYRLQANSKTVSRERQQLREGYDVACQFGGGGTRSWYLYNIYYPSTSKLKRWLFARASTTRLFK